MILWVWAGEWFIRSLSAGLLSVRAIRGRIIVSRVLGTLQRVALQSAEWAVPRAHLSTVLSRIVFMLSRPCKAASDTRSVNRVWWILSGANHPSWWLGQPGKLQFFNQTPNKMMDPPWPPGHSWHLTSWSWQWHPSRDRVLICQYKICQTNFKICIFFLIVSGFIRSWQTDRLGWVFISNVCYEVFDSDPDMSRQNASVNTSPGPCPPYLASLWRWSDQLYE